MIKVKFFPCNPFGELCYLVWDEASKHCLVVDPGMCNDQEWMRLYGFITDNNLVPESVLITHSHTDHIMGAGYLKREYPDIPIYGSEEDQNHLPPIQFQNQMFGIEVTMHYAPITHNVSEGDSLTLQGVDNVHKINVIDCPGHSHHGLCYYFVDDAVIFSGDVLFAGSVGRSDLGMAMGGNGQLLREGIANKLFVLPGDVKVFPGHGMHTTIGYERETNPYV